jgi:hypothetical protein
MNTIYHRGLSLEETQAVKRFHLAGIFKTGKEKVYLTETICNNCHEKVDQLVLMCEYSDGSWLKEKDIELCPQEYDVEIITISRQICSKCLKNEDTIAVINYYRRFIREEYWSLLNNGAYRHKEPSEAFETIITAACRAALFEGNYNNWKSFLPKRVVEELEKRG